MTVNGVSDILPDLTQEEIDKLTDFLRQFGNDPSGGGQ
jgi:hypothetical protein